jgi:hypothetical protein
VHLGKEILLDASQNRGASAATLEKREASSSERGAIWMPKRRKRSDFFRITNSPSLLIVTAIYSIHCSKDSYFFSCFEVSLEVTQQKP